MDNRMSDRSEKISLNCQIEPETDKLLTAWKQQAAEEMGVRRLSYGWMVDELVKFYLQARQSTKTLQSVVVKGKIQ
jgi:hypothetical protein